MAQELIDGVPIWFEEHGQPGGQPLSGPSPRRRSSRSSTTTSKGPGAVSVCDGSLSVAHPRRVRNGQRTRSALLENAQALGNVT